METLEAGHRELSRQVSELRVSGSAAEVQVLRAMVENVAGDVAELKGEQKELEGNVRDSQVEMAGFRERALTHSKAPDVLGVLAERENAKKAKERKDKALDRLWSLGEKLAILAAGGVAMKVVELFWTWYTGPK